MPRNQQPDLPVIPSPQLSFAGGINTSVPKSRMADDEAFDIINFRFNDESSLVARNGTFKYVDRISGSPIVNRTTSVYHAIYQLGGVREILTSSNQIYTITAGVVTNITGGLTLPTNTFWQWKSYNNLAIGVNRGTGANANPVKVASAGNAAALGGTPPKAKYIEVWNDRVWLSGAIAGSENTVFASALGNPEDWTTTGAAGTIALDIDKDDGDRITGLIAFRERLFVFKTRKIYTIQAIAGAAPTDATAMTRNLYAQNIGCVSGYSIVPILDDVLYLSANGVASLVASERVGDFNSALLSRKVQEIKGINFTGTTDVEIAAISIPDDSQYLLMIPEALLPGLLHPKPLFDADVTYVMDYRNIQNGLVRWTRFSGPAAGTVACNTTRKSILIGGRLDGATSNYVVSEYFSTLDLLPNEDNKTGTDGEKAINKQIMTKRFDFGLPFNRKEFHRMAFDFIPGSSTSDTAIAVNYVMDGNPARTTGWTFTIDDTDVFNGIEQFTADRKFKYDTAIGQRAVGVEFTISNNSIDQAFGLQSMALWYAVLPEKVRQL